eukprot:975735-Pleurochrysis_carterae.AAC.2
MEWSTRRALTKASSGSTHPDTMALCARSSSSLTTRRKPRTTRCARSLARSALVLAIDGVKCRRNLLCGECDVLDELEWPGFASVPDDWEPYAGDPTKPGLYEVDTTDATVFHGWGAYYHVTVVYGLRVCLIKPSQIRRQLIASRLLPRDHFEKTIRMFDQHIRAAYKEMLHTIGGDPLGHAGAEAGA